jgi:hypothetical protein
MATNADAALPPLRARAPMLGLAPRYSAIGFGRSPRMSWSRLPSRSQEAKISQRAMPARAKAATLSL